METQRNIRSHHGPRTAHAPRPGQTLAWLIVWLIALLVACGGATIASAQPDEDASPPQAPRIHGAAGSHGNPGAPPGAGAGAGAGFDRPGPPRDRGPRGEGGPAARQPLSPEQVADMLRTLRHVHPELAGRLEKLNKTDPDRVAQMLQHRFFRLRELIRLRDEDPELFKLRVQDFKLARQTFELIRRYFDLKRDKAGDDDAVAQIRTQIRGLVAEHFEVRQQARAHELATLEKRLGEMRRDLDRRAAERDGIIDSRINDLLSGKRPPRGQGPDDGTPPPPPPPAQPDGDAW